MRYLTRYIIACVINHILLVVLILLGVQSFLTLIGELNSIGHGHYSMIYALQVVVYRLPGYMYQLFPVSGLIGAMIALSRLASSRELVIMQVSGLSVLQITRSVLIGAILLMLCMTACGEWFAPHLSQHAAQIRNRALERVDKQFKSGIWLKEANNYLYVKRLLSPQHAEGASFFAYQKGNQLQLKSMLTAQRIERYKPGEWLWHHVAETHYNYLRVRHRLGHNHLLRMNINPHLSVLRPVMISYLTLPELYQKIKITGQVGLSTATMRFDFWHRMLQPLTTIIMIGLAVPFVFGALREKSASDRLLVGVGIGFLFYVLNQILGPLSLVLKVQPVLAAGVPILLFLSLFICFIVTSRSG